MVVLNQRAHLLPDWLLISQYSRHGLNISIDNKTEEESHTEPVP